MAAAAVLVLAALGGGCRAAIDPAAIEDAQLAARVKTALVNDPELGPRAIEVRVYQGRAILSGRVLSEEEMQRLLRLVQAVPGITGVDSSVRVGPVPLGPVMSGRTVEESEEMAPEGDHRLLAVGASMGWRSARLHDLSARTSFGPLVRFGSGTGLAPTIDFNWFTADLFTPTDTEVGNVRIKPLMAGLGYTTRHNRVSLTLSVVGGYAFNALHLAGVVPGNVLALKVTNSSVWRPGASVWYDANRRVAFNVFLGYLQTRPTVTWLVDGEFDQRQLRADTALVSVGVAYKLF